MIESFSTCCAQKYIDETVFRLSVSQTYESWYSHTDNSVKDWEYAPLGLMYVIYPI